MFTSDFYSITYVCPDVSQYNNIESIYAQMASLHTNMHFMDKLPIYEDFECDIQTKNNILLIIDDFQNSVFSSPFISDIFCKFANHANLNILVLLQNPYSSQKFFQNIVRSANFITLFRNVADKSLLSLLGRKLLSYEPRFLQKAMDIAMKELGPRCYIIINCEITNELATEYPVMTRIFPIEENGLSVICPIVFCNT
jgi:hypothetical protein